MGTMGKMYGFAPQGYILCKILWWWGKQPLGKKIQNEDLGGKNKIKGKKQGKNDIKNGVKGLNIASFCVKI